MEQFAAVSENKQYRYSLLRLWDIELPRICFVMLNPSTADGEKDDPTIRKCIGFAKKLGYGSLDVVNLYAYRSTDPKELRKIAYPVGPENDKYIQAAIARSYLVVAAWGINATDPVRVNEVLDLIGSAMCLGRTNKGAPRHPLFVPYNTELIRYCKEGRLIE